MIARRAPTGPIFRVSTEPPEDVAPRTKRFCFSDGSVDRLGDRIDPDGWDLQEFRRNPVALWAHDSLAPPVGRARNVFVEGRRLMGDIEFAPPEVYPFADTIFRLVDGKWLNAVSVGFLPTAAAFVENDPDRRGGIDFQRQTLIEISIVPVPANANALAEARSKGVNVGLLARGASPARPREAARARAWAAERPRDRSADLARAAEIRARVGGAFVHETDYVALRLAQARQDDARLRAARAAADRVAQSTQWW